MVRASKRGAGGEVCSRFSRSQRQCRHSVIWAHLAATFELLRHVLPRRAGGRWRQLEAHHLGRALLGKLHQVVSTAAPAVAVAREKFHKASRRTPCRPPHRRRRRGRFWCAHPGTNTRWPCSGSVPEPSRSINAGEAPDASKNWPGCRPPGIFQNCAGEEEATCVCAEAGLDLCGRAGGWGSRREAGAGQQASPAASKLPARQSRSPTFLVFLLGGTNCSEFGHRHMCTMPPNRTAGRPLCIPHGGQPCPVRTHMDSYSLKLLSRSWSFWAPSSAMAAPGWLHWLRDIGRASGRSDLKFCCPRAGRRRRMEEDPLCSCREVTESALGSIHRRPKQ